MYNGRIRKTLKILRKKKLAGLLLSNPLNIRYLTGISFPAWLLISEKGITLFTSFLYITEAVDILRDLPVRVKDYGRTPETVVTAAMKRDRLINVGYEEKKLRYGTVISLRGAADKAGTELVDATGTIELLRAVKDRYELAQIRKAITYTLSAFDYLGGLMQAGMTEKALLIEAERYLKIGADPELAFDPIIAGGPSSAKPHYKSLANRLAPDTGVLVDIGCKVNGYCADLTRMFFLGTIPRTLVKVRDIVDKASDRAIKKIKPGVSASDVDTAARSWIEKHGYGRYFGHGTGHGVGLNVHEYPTLSPGSSDILQEGMIVTIEPGIYLPRVGGYRQEHMVRVTGKGYQVLDYPMKGTA